MLSQLQLRVERTLFEAIRLVLVAEGYIPDITNTVAYGAAPYSKINETAWDAAVAAIAAGAKGFAIEALQNSQSKGVKKVPRIVIVPRNSMPGDIGGTPTQTYYTENTAFPGIKKKVTMPLETTHMYMDVHLITNTATQDRILNAVLAKAMGHKKFIPYYDQPDNSLFVRQWNYYDIPDPIEGLQERIYAYEVPDLYDVLEEYESAATITEITTVLTVLDQGSSVNPVTGNPIGAFFEDGGLVIDASGIDYNLP